MIGIPQALSAVAIVVIGALADNISMPTALTWQAALLVLVVALCVALPYSMKHFGRKDLPK